MTLWELLAELLGMTIIGLGTLLLGSTAIIQWSGWVALGGLLLIGVIITSQMQWPWRLLVTMHIRAANRMLAMLAELGFRRFRLMAKLSVMTTLSWLVALLGFYVLLDGMGIAEAITLPQAMTSFAIAWVVGLLVIISPSGLGPREATLTVLLSPIFGATVAFSVALLARIWWALGETIHILIALLWSTVRAGSALDH